jgi:hypothetical protein
MTAAVPNTGRRACVPGKGVEFEYRNPAASIANKPVTDATFKRRFEARAKEPEASATSAPTPNSHARD